MDILPPDLLQEIRRKPLFLLPGSRLGAGIRSHSQPPVLHLVRAGGHNLDNLHIWTLRGASANPEELLERIIDETRADHYALIMLDPIYKLMVGRSENMAGGVGALCHNVERLVEQTGAAVIYCLVLSIDDTVCLEE
jgi:hypothetical protein